MSFIIFSRTNIFPLPTFISPFHSTSCVERDFFFMYLVWSLGFRDCVHKTFFVSILLFNQFLYLFHVLCSRTPVDNMTSYNFSNSYCYPVSAIPMIMSSSIWFALDAVVISNVDFIVYSPLSTLFWLWTVTRRRIP